MHSSRSDALNGLATIPKTTGADAWKISWRTPRHASLTRAGATKTKDMKTEKENQQHSGSGLESSSCSASDSDGDSTLLSGQPDPIELHLNQFLNRSQNEHLIIYHPAKQEVRLLTTDYENGRYQKMEKMKLNWFGRLILKWSGIKF